MHLKEASKILEVWEYALKERANIIVMRHGPKAGSDQSDLSEEGLKLTEEYGKILMNLGTALDGTILVATSKSRTTATLKAMLPDSEPDKYLRPPELDTVIVTLETQRDTDDFHAELGHWRGYTVSQTYFYLQRYTGGDDGRLHSEVIPRVAKGIKKLFDYARPVIYCGHSPQSEAAVAKLTGIDLTELGWFLNPLSSLHLRMQNGKIGFVARINPIIGYIDLESEIYYKS